MKGKLFVLRWPETELRNVRQLIDNEVNQVKNANMVNVCSKMSMMLTGNDMYNVRESQSLLPAGWARHIVGCTFTKFVNKTRVE